MINICEMQRVRTCSADLFQRSLTISVLSCSSSSSSSSCVIRASSLLFSSARRELQTTREEEEQQLEANLWISLDAVKCGCIYFYILQQRLLVHTSLCCCCSSLPGARPSRSESVSWVSQQWQDPGACRIHKHMKYFKGWYCRGCWGHNQEKSQRNEIIS